MSYAVTLGSHLESLVLGVNHDKMYPRNYRLMDKYNIIYIDFATTLQQLFRANSSNDCILNILTASVLRDISSLHLYTWCF